MPKPITFIAATSTDKRKLSALVLAMLLAGTCASVLTFWTTAYAPGVTPDSAVYIETARNLFSKKSFFAYGEPLIHYPPIYPLFLALGGVLESGHVLQASRWLGGLFFAANIVLLGIAVQACTERNLFATGSAMLLFLSSAPIISMHSMAWSEPPFITFTLLSLLLLSVHVIRPRFYWLVASSLFIGLALITRYVGIALLPPMVFALLFFGDRLTSHKITDAVVGTVVASLPLACWVVRNLVIAKSATDRTFAIHPLGFNHAAELIGTLYDFFLPISTSDHAKGLQLALAAALLVLAVWLLRRKNCIHRNEQTFCIVLPALCLAFSLSYIVVLLISASFFDAMIPFDARMLSPIFVTLTIAGISLAWSLSRALERTSIWYTFVFLAALSITVNGVRAVSAAVALHNNGRGYTSRSWENSQVISYLSELRDTRKIYSNEPLAVGFLAGKEAITTPEKISKFTRKVNGNYEEQLNRIFGECREGKVLVAYVNAIQLNGGGKPTGKPVSTDEERLVGAKLPVLARFTDGIVYGRIAAG